MGETSKEFVEWVAYVQAYSYPDNAITERVNLGDILSVHRKSSVRGLGTKEATRLLLVPIQGLESSDISQLKDLVFQDPLDITSPRFEKRRYCIPFPRLQELDPIFDQAQAKDPLVVYQPWMHLGEDDLLVFDCLPPFEVEGLIYDKVIGNYL